MWGQGRGFLVFFFFLKKNNNWLSKQCSKKIKTNPNKIYFTLAKQKLVCKNMTLSETFNKNKVTTILKIVLFIDHLYFIMPLTVKTFPPEY